MQDTGMVRRMDDLGRVVIPKEIRKTLRIKEGDPLEIYTDKDTLLLKKYSPILSVSEQAKIIVNGITKVTGKGCVVTDTNKVIHYTRSRTKEYEDKGLSDELTKVLDQRKNVIVCKRDGGEVIPLYVGEQTDEIENQIIVPIISGGDCYGAVCLFDRENEARFSSSDVKLVEVGATFLANHFE
ncbi:MAG: AbrB/MazE/SpoVT family DNA-binding domain-containing protein [Clostridia bacterium]|jgi:AbrB family transcriptional regulator (stage V sporulation protein T)|nr:AbrB/MazE/SpoVT family DNA-binding domain-containing protein [Clostridia bacterium]